MKHTPCTHTSNTCRGRGIGRERERGEGREGGREGGGRREEREGGREEEEREGGTEGGENKRKRLTSSARECSSDPLWSTDYQN